MINLLEGSVYFSVFLGIASYWLGRKSLLYVKKDTRY